MDTIDSLADDLSSYLGKDQINSVRRAYYYAEQAHEGQYRHSGDAYVTHPLAVASILSEMHMDHQSLMAAMLHDVIEDTGVTKTAIKSQFGNTVADLVDGVSKLNKITFSSHAEAQAENFQKMAMAMAKDLRVILVKIADRLHNMRTLKVLAPDKRRRIGRETLDIYAPIANRLGMNNVRVEFEELCFAALYPMRARRITAAVKRIRGNRKEIVLQIQTSLEACLEREGLPGRTIGREKHLYSIYEKMRSQHKSFSEITDVYAFRIIVDRVDACYRVLGAVHSLYKPVPGRFKDYIAIPKANGYQSLHTTLFGMHGVPIEIQIRTEEMEAMANNGIASHWLYKSTDDLPSNAHIRAREWVNGLLDIQKHAGNSLEFIENVKIDLFPDEIYVFTPKGTIFELPAGSTAVDFAYAIHTDVGNSCVACRISRRLAPLSEPLQSGQTVEVITAPGTQPNPAWLSFVITGKARSNIRHYLKNQKHSESVSLGRRLLNKALASFGSDLASVTKENIDAVLTQTKLKSLDQLLEEIGLGNRMSYMIAQKLAAHSSIATLEDGNEPEQQGTLAIRGSEGMVMNYAKCCHPIPGDPIVGHISSGRGMVIHTDECNNIAEIRDNPEKCVAVSWDPNVEGEFSVELRVELENLRGIIATLATTITGAEANIEKISTVERDARFIIVNLSLNVRNRVHLAHVMKRVRLIKAVASVTRVKSRRVRKVIKSSIGA
ncbi:MAG: bifunctional GTP diphosphokinase/guanosine-3',5'-bis(diphosphate) 3'-diphosphatase [Gammaproteobacteria bacterium]|nr:bifunctional GTP diphosphokinase/guanosine-3',5'-bis(diphosphate) 3'-diphosphatase [Gammaproteobacteria bacterium]MEC7766074.1 bifunctional GTP diphosphokinase/guanosine-3',5'-bis pyrophosphate 3'-pyrophosphohydrolase [Pseudomonadota bacterium]MBI91328.1 bifunctional GTP diphosphokinase/guanosine-3',5'-bis(diphosphate) 3'-diphosphatase [Gammaproteobacteria bacterium]MEC8950270.1 bifunctional GTP diphosphokinase/guanosine-3',5'-bis pyrophosphate 3'-pyrophosphohydrolase [Pseudomonadota bacteriu